MGQIIGSAAKPKRCNISQLSQLGIPAAGEYILVSSDNSMNAAGQGNFDCYIVGDGTTAATALELKNVETHIDAFDISSYHATGGVLAKYADLTAALNDGNNIPQSFRKGGMSIKFVQSSDNKYVQYLLTKNEWSARESDWEKMNLEDEVNQLDVELNGQSTDVDVTPTTQTGYYYNVNNGVITSATGATTANYSGTVSGAGVSPTGGVDISQYVGKTLRVIVSGGSTSSSRKTAITDSNTAVLTNKGENNFIQDANDNTKWYYDFVIPQNARYFFWSGVRSLVSVTILQGEQIIGLESRVETLEGMVDADNPQFISSVTDLDGAGVNQSSVLESRYIKESDGTIGVSSSYNIRWYNVRRATKVYVETQGKSNAVAIAFYGVGGVGDLVEKYAIDDIKSFTLDVPSTAYMLGVTYIKTFALKVSIAQGSKTPVVHATNIMEIGDININSSGFTYRYLNTRARTIYKTPVHLVAGDRVFTDGTVKLYYAGNTKGGYVYGGWVDEIPIYYEGDYVFESRFNTEAAPTDGNKEYITDHIYIQSNNAYSLLEEGNRILSPFNNWDRTIRSVNHRGYSVMAPENTLSAFRLSKQNGFGYIETDIFFTADDEIVCIHDETVDRTSDGTGYVSEMTLAELKNLDFGSWFSPTYAGTKIPTLEETLSLCHNIGIGCYIELKTQLTAERASQVLNTVKACGMHENVVYVSFALQPLQAMSLVDNTARLGWLGTVSQENINNMLALRANGNPVFMDSSDVSDEAVSLCLSNNIEQEYWITEQEPNVENLPKSIVGLTSNHLVAGRILYLGSINN